ncbi:MAG: YihY/virulence factor BrkB family protein [Bacteroidota bacterium]|nr:YihY/virulence factor BrkB family protein [Bacteroidota bacterium]
MHLYTKIRRSFITTAPVSWLIRKSKHILLPGFKGIPLFDVIRFLFLQFKKTGLSERSASIAFNLLSALPPAIIFLFTLVPYLPISRQFIDELFHLIRDVIPAGKDNSAIIDFLNDFITTPRNGLLSFGFLLALYYSSNAVLGIMRSFDRNYVGFVKRTTFENRVTALKITLMLFVVVIVSVILLIMQQTAVLKWIGIKSWVLQEIIKTFRWVVIILLFFFSISFIYRYAPATHKKWKPINAGSILATFLMILFTLIFAYWVNNFSNYNRLYGSIGTILILMLIIYFNSFVLLIGFELNVSINALKREVDERKAAEAVKARLHASHAT